MSAVIDTLEALLVHAHALEKEAVERYEELAEQMEVHNNPELAALFHKMAVIEGKHVTKVEALAGDTPPQALPPWEYRWPTLESPESVPVGQEHYRLTPHTALQLMLACEERAFAFFHNVATKAPDTALRATAMEFAEDERNHAELLQQWLQRYPAPAADWKVDLDEPVAQE